MAVEWIRVNFNLSISQAFSFSDGCVHTWSIVRTDEAEEDKNCWISGLDIKKIGYDSPQRSL